MEHKPVKSSNIESIGYDPTSKVLEVKFSGGRVYAYHDVPYDVHFKLMSAESKGKFVHAVIKKNHKCTPVT